MIPFAPRLLLVEDNAADALILMSLLKEARFSGEMDWVRDGEQALAYLHREGDHAKAQLPHLILLDLGLPRLNGYEVLRAIRHSEPLKRLNVCILSSSDMADDIFKCHQLGVAKFYSKPNDLGEYERLVSQVIRMIKPLPA